MDEEIKARKGARSDPSVLLGIAFFSFVSIGLQGGALGVAWLSMQSSFGVTLESLGVLLIAGTVGGFVVSLYSGLVISRLGLGFLCLAGCLVGSLGLVLAVTTSVWRGLVVAALLLGIGRAGVNAGVNTFVANAYPTSRMNWLHAVYGVGSTLGPLLLTFIVVDLERPWQLGYGALLGIHLGVALLFLATFSAWRLRSPVSTPQDPQQAGPDLSSSLKLLPLWLGVALFALHVGIQVSAGQLSNNLFVEGRGVDPKTAGVWIALFWAFITVGRVVSSLVVDRLGVANLLRYATAGTVLGALLLWWNPVNAVSFLGLALMGFTLAPVFPSSVSRTPQLVGAYHSPNAIGIQMAGAAFGGALLPSAVGYLGDNVGLALIPPCIVALSLAQFFVHEAMIRRERIA